MCQPLIQSSILKWKKRRDREEAENKDPLPLLSYI